MEKLLNETFIANLKHTFLCFSISFLSFGSSSVPKDECFLPDPDQYYLLTTTAEGNFQHCREHRSRHGYRSSGNPPNSASRVPNENKFVQVEMDTVDSLFYPST